MRLEDTEKWSSIESQLDSATIQEVASAHEITPGAMQRTGLVRTSVAEFGRQHH
jgi:hypothetical protein